MTAKKTTYWAAEAADDLASSLNARWEAWEKMLQSSGVAYAIKKNWDFYNGLFYDSIGGRIVFDSEDAQALLSVNHYRANLRTILNYTTSTAPQWDPQAANDENEAMEATVLANQVLDYEVEASPFEKLARDAAEWALIYLVAYLLTEWDATRGKPYEMKNEEYDLKNPQSLEFKYEGDRRYAILTPFQVMFDHEVSAWSDVFWVRWTELKPKWDTANVFFSQYERIVALSNDRKSRFWDLECGIVKSEVESDQIPVHTFLHLPTPSMPKGRLLQVAGDDVILTDGPLPPWYKRLPLHRIVHSETPGSILVGHSPANDMSPIQEAINAEISTIVTNHAKYGEDKIWKKYGEPINVQSFEGSDIIESETEMKRFPVMGTTPELLTTLKELIQQMRAISGIADASMGQVSRETAGISLALNDASTIQNNKSFDFNYRQLLEGAGQSIIEIFQAAPLGPCRISVVGENKKAQLITFQKEALQPVQRVIAKLGPAILRGDAGRMQMMEFFRNIPGLITRPEQIIEVMHTGRMEPLTKAEDNQRKAINDAIAALRKGATNIPIMATDNLLLWVREIQAGILSDVNSRYDSAVTQEAAIVMGRCLEMFYKDPVTQMLLGWVAPQQLAAALQLKALSMQAGAPMAAPPAPAGAMEEPAGPMQPPATPAPLPAEGIIPIAQQNLSAARVRRNAGAMKSPLPAGMTA